jgi:uncharacterized delta-60 repeat protein
MRCAIELQNLESRTLFSGPAAIFSVAPTFTPGASNFAVSVDYSDTVPINPATIAPANLSVSGATVGALQVTGDVVSSQSPGELLVTYYVNAPNQIFDQRANDTYTITVQPNSVLDTQGAAAATVSTTMSVGVSPITGPLAVASAPSFQNVDAAGTTSETLEITYSDTVPINLATIDGANLSAGGMSVQLLSAASQDGGDVVHAAYQLTAPRGAFYPADDTGYHVVLVSSGPGAVLDSAGNAFSSGVLALYEVVVDPFSATFSFADSTSPSFVPEASAKQSDGKLIVVGHAGDTTAGLSQIEIERFNTDGTLDTTFGSNGVVLGPTGENEAAFAIQMLPNDEFLIAGTSQKEFALERYSANGTLDPTFGPSGTGEVTTAINSDAAIEMADAIALAPNGSIVIAGQSDGSWAFAQFTPSGIFSSSFLYALPSGKDGAVGGVAVQSNGMIVAAGDDGLNVDVARFTPTGTPDSSFNSGRIQTLAGMSVRNNLGYLDHNVGLGIDPSGNIVIAATSSSSPAFFATQRLLPDGSPDTSFGTNGTGLVTTSFNGNADAQQVAFQTGGVILVSGVNVNSGGTQPVSITYNSNGTLFTGAVPPPALSISGIVFNGQSGAPQSGVTVFLDSNQNGALDGGETSTTTNASGEYFFSDVSAGDYAVDEVTPAGFVAQTSETNVTVSGSSASGPNFDNLPAPASAGTPAPDLTALFVSSIPSSVVGGSSGRLTLNLSNIGQADAVGVIQIALFATSNGAIGAGDTPFATIPQWLNLKSGHSTRITLKFKYPSNLVSGNYFLIASPDSTNSIVQSNDSNNLAVSSSQVAIGLPLARLGGTLQAPPSVKIGKRSTATLLLNNSGNVAASGIVSISVFASSDQLLDAGAVSLATIKIRVRLLPGRSARYRVPLTALKGFVGGSQFVIARLDASAIPGIGVGTLVIPAGAATMFG